MESLPSTMYMLLSTLDAGTFVFGLTVAFFALVINRAVLSPLRHVPGPFLCRFSDLPAICMAVRGRKALWTHSLFLKYGPLVRTGPSTVSCNSVVSMKNIYGNSWAKGDFYEGLTFEGKVHMLGVSDPKEAIKRRRAVMPTFSTANLKATTPLMHSYIEEFTTQVEKAHLQEGSVDVFRWYRLLAFDIIADLAFEHKFNMLEKGAQSEIVDLIHGAITYGVASTLVPGLDLIVATLGTAGMRRWKQAQHSLGKMGTSLYREHMSKPFEERSSTILSSFQAHYIAAGCDASTTAALVASEAAALLIAGSDTTSMTLVYLTYLLALNPHVQDRLQAELDAALPDRDHLPFVQELDRLEYLGAVIKEVLRLHPAVPGDLPRRVPPGGAVLDDYFLPGKTTISCQPYSINRLPGVFGEDADWFNPDRFLDEPPEMKQASFSFSFGPRNCAGMNLAHAELKIITAYVFRRYTISLAPETTPASMVPTESFFTAPIAMATRVRLVTRD